MDTFKSVLIDKINNLEEKFNILNNINDKRQKVLALSNFISAIQKIISFYYIDDSSLDKLIQNQNTNDIHDLEALQYTLWVFDMVVVQKFSKIGLNENIRYELNEDRLILNIKMNDNNCIYSAIEEKELDKVKNVLKRYVKYVDVFAINKEKIYPNSIKTYIADKIVIMIDLTNVYIKNLFSDFYAMCDNFIDKKTRDADFLKNNFISSINDAKEILFFNYTTDYLFEYYIYRLVIIGGLIIDLEKNKNNISSSDLLSDINIRKSFLNMKKYHLKKIDRIYDNFAEYENVFILLEKLYDVKQSVEELGFKVGVNTKNIMIDKNADIYMEIPLLVDENYSVTKGSNENKISYLFLNKNNRLITTITGKKYLESNEKNEVYLIEKLYKKISNLKNIKINNEEYMYNKNIIKSLTIKLSCITNSFIGDSYKIKH